MRFASALFATLLLVADLMSAAEPALGVFDLLRAPERAAAGTPPGPDTVRPALVSPRQKGPPLAPIGPANTAWDAEAGVARPALTVSPALGRQPALGRPLPSELAPLTRLIARGHAAGLAGVLYDNRDRNHSRLPPTLFPRLARTAYGPEARAAGADYGPNRRLIFPLPVIGNSSTARTGGPFWRSQPRLMLTTPGAPADLWRLYAANHLYVYPEHRDHDPAGVREPGRNGAAAGPPGKGDLFPAQTPYMVISQGSSGSDRPVLVALAAALAALPPRTRALAEQEGLIAPTLQMLLRSTLRGVPDLLAYLGPAGHAPVIDPARLDLDRLIAAAHALTADTLPGMVRLQMVEETVMRPEAVFADGLGERLFDTPGAIARIWRGPAATRSYVLDAGGSTDPNGQALQFHWRVVTAAPGQVTVRPLDAEGRRARIDVTWTDRRPDAPGRLVTDRIDIAVIADNGSRLSAPAYFSVAFAAEQARRLEPGPDGRTRPAEIAYAAHPRRDRYTDPMLFPRRNWTDRYAYDAEGRLLGWVRQRGKAETAFTRLGHRITDRDAAGRPVRAVEVAYPLHARPNGVAEVRETPTGRAFLYRYRDAEDRFGRPEPVPGTP
ncbi:MAG: hypothetical protein AAF317_00910 [Pseudomonadota bacterium]